MKDLHFSGEVVTDTPVIIVKMEQHVKMYGTIWRKDMIIVVFALLDIEESFVIFVNIDWLKEM